MKKTTKKASKKTTAKKGKAVKRPVSVKKKTSATC